MKRHDNKLDPHPNIKLIESQTDSESTSEQNLNLPEEELENSETEYSQNDETLDMAILQELIRDEEKSLELLIKDNDRAADFILAGDLPSAVSILEKMEKLMEYIATNGKVLDRNIIIVCLYNLASAHQANWTLDKCAKYIEAVTYNLAQSIKHDEVGLEKSRPKIPEDFKSQPGKSITLRKKLFLVKVYLQYCAVSSQLNRHEESMKVAQKAHQVMLSILNECLQFCRTPGKEPEFESRLTQTPQKNTDRSRMTTVSGVSVDLRKSLLNDVTFRDEVYYKRQIIENAIPFLEDLLKNSQEFSKTKMQEKVDQTRTLLFNWKNNPENNEKYIRKELTKAKVPAKLREENRTLLGVQHDSEWVSTLNIGSIMHMKPLKYKDYAQRKEFINELTKTSLQEKAIFQSLTFFTISTEMRFIEMSSQDSNLELQEDGSLKENNASPKGSRLSEAYHLKAIEFICRYISGPCPYINHLITSYQKHYGQDLETIPEESLNSVNSSFLGKNLKKEDKIPFTNERLAQEAATVIKLQSINPLEQQKKPAKRMTASRERGKVATRELHNEHFLTNEDEKYKEMRRDRKKDSFKSLNIRTAKLSNKVDELKKVYTNNLSLNSPIRNTKTELSTLSPKLFKLGSGRYDTEAFETLEDRLRSKKNANVPTLGLQNVLLKDLTTPQHMSGKPSMQQQHQETHGTHGFRSERVEGSPNYKMPGHINSSEPERGKKMGSPGEMNVYLYKNFNKFIQNFYVKNDEMQRQKALENKIKEKYMNHPYQKEQPPVKQKKVVLEKKTSSKGDNHPKTPTYIRPHNLSPMERAVFSEEFKRAEIRRPKTGNKRATTEEAVYATRNLHSQSSARMNEGYVLNSKEIDFLKGGLSLKKG